MAVLEAEDAVEAPVPSDASMEDRQVSAMESPALEDVLPEITETITENTVSEAAAVPTPGGAESSGPAAENGDDEASLHVFSNPLFNQNTPKPAPVHLP